MRVSVLEWATATFNVREDMSTGSHCCIALCCAFTSDKAPRCEVLAAGTIIVGVPLAASFSLVPVLPISASPPVTLTHFGRGGV